MYMCVCKVGQINCFIKHSNHFCPKVSELVVKVKIYVYSSVCVCVLREIHSYDVKKPLIHINIHTACSRRDSRCEAAVNILFSCLIVIADFD